MTTRLNLVMASPSLLSDTLTCPTAMDEYDDKTESSDGFAIFIVRDTQIFEAMDEYDKT